MNRSGVIWRASSASLNSPTFSSTNSRGGPPFRGRLLRDVDRVLVGARQEARVVAEHPVPACDCVGADHLEQRVEAGPVVRRRRSRWSGSSGGAPRSTWAAHCARPISAPRGAPRRLPEPARQCGPHGSVMRRRGFARAEPSRGPPRARPGPQPLPRPATPRSGVLAIHARAISNSTVEHVLEDREGMIAQTQRPPARWSRDPRPRGRAARCRASPARRSRAARPPGSPPSSASAGR